MNRTDDDEKPNLQPMPQYLETSHTTNQLLNVEKDRLTVSYKGPGQHSNDVGAIRSDYPVPRDRKIYYYEISIINEGDKRKIGLLFFYLKLHLVLNI